MGSICVLQRKKKAQNLQMLLNTLPETNVAPENRGPLESRRFRSWKPPFSGAFTVSFREGISLEEKKDLRLVAYASWVYYGSHILLGKLQRPQPRSPQIVV